MAAFAEESLLAGEDPRGRSVRAGGLLAALVQLWVWRFLLAAPLTLDAGRWYAWRSWFVVALVVVLAIWGFRNVLGKQSALPAGALDG